MRQFLLLVALAILSPALCKEHSENDLDNDNGFKGWKAQVGDLCEYNSESSPLPADVPDRFLECIQPFRSKDLWPWVDKGVWSYKRCKPGMNFLPANRTCVSKKYIRRQQSLCEGPNAASSNICPSKSVSVRYVIRRQQVNTNCQQTGQTQMCGQTQIMQPIAQPIQQPYRPVQQPYQPIQQPYQPVQQPYQPQQQQCPCPQPRTNICPTQCPRPVIQPRPQPQPQPCPCPQPQTTRCPTQCPQPQQPRPQPVIQPRPQQPCSCNQQPMQPQQPQQQGCGCGGQPPAVVQPQPCPGAPQGYQGAQEGGTCSWMLAPLAPHQDPKSYLQCQPAAAPASPYCGTWCRRPCAPGTIFDVQVQVCVHDPNAQPRPGSSGGCGCQQGGTSIGSCNTNYQCPGQAVCQVQQPQQPIIQQPIQQPVQQQGSCSSCCISGGGNYGKK